MQTQTDEEIASQISNLPNDWKVTNPHGKLRTKKDLEFCIWGVEKEGDNVVYFEKDILEKYPPPHKKIAIRLHVGRSNTKGHSYMETPRVELHLLGRTN